ncbi:MAG: sulfite exporter TauE/SafE family protein [Acidimicrobiia bacterium]|nr:sulfite exporter TauE/SafE family protein [Acidimicrobiia bacterium]
MDPGPLRDVLTLLAGVATGTMSGLFGVGGAVISTPAIRALGASATIAVGTTLPSIIPGAASGTARYVREQLIDFRIVTWTAPAGVVAAVVGSRLSKAVPGNGHVLMLMTAALLGFSAWRTYATGGRDEAGAESDSEAADLALPVRDAGASNGRYLAIGTAAGLLSGLLGVGGGIVMVPAFTQLARVPLKTAIATSLACVAIFAIPGTITHAIQGDIDWRFALLLAVGVIPGARLGAALTVRADSQRLRVVVALFLGGTAILYAVGELLALL